MIRAISAFLLSVAQPNPTHGDVCDPSGWCIGCEFATEDFWIVCSIENESLDTGCGWGCDALGCSTWCW